MDTRAAYTEALCNRIAKSVALDLQSLFQLKADDLSVTCRALQNAQTRYCVTIRSAKLSCEDHLTSMTFSRVNIVFSNISGSNDAPMIVLSSKPLRSPAP